MAAAMLLFPLTSTLAHVKHARVASAKWQCGLCNTSYKGYGRSGEPRSRRAKAWRRNSRSSHDSRMPTSCPPQYVSRTSSTGPHRRSLTISKPESQALLLILVAHVSPWFVLQRRLQTLHPQRPLKSQPAATKPSMTRRVDANHFIAPTAPET